MEVSSLRLLGRPDLGTATSRRLLEPGQVSQFLAYLGYRATWVRRDELIALFWPEGDDPSGRRNLRRLLFRARQRLETHASASVPAIDVEGDVLRWAVPTDVISWREALDQGDFETAFGLWRGRLCDGLDSRATSDVSAWLQMEREQHAQRWKDAVLPHAEHLASGRPEDAEQLLARLGAIDPLDEEVVRSRLRMLARSGRPVESERVYRGFAKRLEQDLGLEPAPETMALMNPAHQAVGPGHDEARPGQAKHTTPVPFTLPFVGRDAHLAMLEEHLARASFGTGGAVVIEGEAGVGKTRLADEFLAAAEARGIPVYRGKSYERELGAPLEPIRDALASLISDIPAEVMGFEHGWSGERRVLSDVHQMLSAHLIGAGRAHGVAILFVDDIQWADAATLDYLAYAAKRVAVEPVLVLVGQRREDRGTLQAWHSDLADRRVLHTLALERLANAELRDVLSGMGGLSSEDAAWFSDFVHAQTEGNPFYVTEYVRWLSRETALEADDAGRLVRIDRERIAAAELPENVLALIWSRYRGFPKETRDLLDLAAVTGRAFDLTLLQAAIGASPGSFWTSFAPLVTAGLMVEDDDGAFSFSHDKLRQTIYHRLGPPIRRELHAVLAAALARVGAEPSDLAHHHLRSRNYDAAFEQLLAAGAQAERQCAWAAALQAYRRADEITHQLDDARRRGFEVLEAMERMLELMDRRSERAAVVERMLGVAREEDDDRLEIRAHLKRIGVRALTGDHDGVRASRQRAMQLLERLGDASGEAKVYRELAYAAFSLGDDRGVAGAGLGAIQVYRAEADTRNEATTAWNVATAFRRMGRTDEALEWASRAATLYAELGSDAGDYMRFDMKAWAQQRNGDIAGACASLQEALERAKALGEKHLVIEKHMNLGSALLEAGAIQRALEHFQEGGRIGAEIGDPRHEGYPLLQAAAAWQRLGDLRAAIKGYRNAARLLGSAYSLSGVAEEQLAQADALTLLGSALAELGSSDEPPPRPNQHGRNHSTDELEPAPDEAIEALDRAAAIATERADDLRASKVLMERGVLHWRTGRFGLSADDFAETAKAAARAGATGREIAAHASRCVALMDGHRTQEGIAAGEEALQRLCSFPDRIAGAYVAKSLARGWTEAGDSARARAYRMRARRLLRAANGAGEF